MSSIKDLDIVNRSGPNKKETDDEDIKKDEELDRLLKEFETKKQETINVLQEKITVK